MTDKLGLEICGIEFVGIIGLSFIFLPDYYYWQEAKEIITKDQKQMAKILVSQMELSDTDFSCDIDFIKRLHDKPICLAKTNVITLTDLGYIMHDYTKNSIMWVDEDKPLGIVKLKGESGKATEYNGTVNKIKVDGTEYYLITNAVFQGNH